MRRELARVVLGGFESRDGDWFQPVALKSGVVTLTMKVCDAPEVRTTIVVEEYQPGAWRLAERQLAGVG